jgi:predicted AlkP superfamily phosphohydrolase/phosphomutase
MEKSKYSVLIFGLDGATFNLMLPWIEQGHLPTMGRLIGEGAWSRLESTIPPITPCAWSSFMTGKNPGKHGLFYFAEPEPNSYKLRFTNASYRRGETLWGHLSRLGLKVGVINVPMTYPPEKVNGYLVSGMDTPNEHNEFTHPKELQKELQSPELGYRLDLRYLGNMTNNERRDRRLEELKEVESLRTRALQHLQRQQPADFNMIVYTATDSVQHHFWHYMDPQHDKYDAANAERYRNAIRDVYIHLDGLIASILKERGDDTVVMLMSDHGFGPTTNVRLRLNQALERAGLLHFAREGGSGKAMRGMVGMISRFLRSSLSARSKALLAGKFPQLRVWMETKSGAAIDWSKTKAFTNEAYRPPSVWLNREGKFPQSTVGLADLESALQEVERALCDLKDPKTGRPVISHVYRARDHYHGPYAANAPDLIPSWWEDGFLQEQSVPGGPADLVVERSRSPIRGGVEFAGSHRLDGVFCMTGGPVRQGHAFTGARIIDVAPTVLYLMGLPIPDDMDGKPLVEGLNTEFVNQRPPEIEHNGALHKPEAPAPEAIFSDAEEDLIAKRLQSLGYIE